MFKLTNERRHSPSGCYTVAAIAVLALSFGCAKTDREKSPEEKTSVDVDARQSGKEPEAPELPERVRLTSTAIAEAGISTSVVKSVDPDSLLVLTGTVDYDENRLLQVASNVRGRIASIQVDLGQRVSRDEPIVWIESIELAHAWDEYVKAIADLRVALRAYERAKSLVGAKAMSAGEFQSREATYLSKRVEAGTAERTLRLYGEPDTEIEAARASTESGAGAVSDSSPHRLPVRAPFNGRVIDRKVTPGSLVEALQPLATIADLSSVWVFLRAHDGDLASLKNGLPVSIRTDAFPQESFSGHVDFIASIVDPATRTFRVRATVRNGAEKLRPGMFVRAQIEIHGIRSSGRLVVAVPTAALQTLDGKMNVFVQSGPGTFARHVVETGREFEGLTEILSGVKPGDVVVTDGSFVLKSEFARATLVDED